MRVIIPTVAAFRKLCDVAFNADSPFRLRRACETVYVVRVPEFMCTQLVEILPLQLDYLSPTARSWPRVASS